MALVSFRIDDELIEKIDQMAKLNRVSRSDMVRIVLSAGMKYRELEKTYFDRIYKACVHNWIFGKKMLSTLLSEEQMTEAMDEAKIFLRKNELGNEE